MLTLDSNHKGETARTIISYESPAYAVAGGRFIQNERIYAVEFHHMKDGTYASRVWLKGRELPENNRQDIRDAAAAAYCAAFEMQIDLRGTAPTLKKTRATKTSAAK